MVKKIILFVGGGLLILFAAGFWYVNYVFIPQQLKPALIEGISQALDKDVVIAQAQYFPFKGIALTGVDIRNRDATPFLSVRTVDVRLKSFPHIKPNDIRANGQLMVQDFSFQQETITVSGNARVDLDAALKGSEPPQFNARLKLDNAAVRGIPSMPPVTDISGMLLVTHGTFKTDDMQARIAQKPLRIIVDGGYTPETITLRHAEVTYNDRTQLVARGVIHDVQALSATLAFDGAIDLADVAIFLGDEILLPALQGNIAVTAEVNGPLADLTQLSGELTATSAQVGIETLRVDDITAVAVLRQGTIICRPVTFGFYQGTGDTVVSIGIVDDGLPIDVVADLENVQLLPLVTDMTGQDIGGGTVNAHIGVTGPAGEPAAINGAGWVNMINGQVKIPARFDRLAKTLQISQMEYMVINDASATFAVYEAKIDSRDITVNADMATMSGVGHVGFDRSVNGEILLRLTRAAVERSGGIGGLSQFVSDKSGLPVTKIRIFGRVPDAMKYQVIPLPVEDILKDAVPQMLKSMIKGDGAPAEGTPQFQQGMDALKGIFR